MSQGEKVGAMLAEQEEYRSRSLKREIDILDEREQRYGDRTIQVEIRHYRQILLERLSLVQHIARLEMMLGYNGNNLWPWGELGKIGSAPISVTMAEDEKSVNVKKDPAK